MEQPVFVYCCSFCFARKKKNGKLTVTLFEHIGVRKKNVITREAEKLWNDIKKIEFEG